MQRDRGVWKKVGALAAVVAAAAMVALLVVRSAPEAGRSEHAAAAAGVGGVERRPPRTLFRVVQGVRFWLELPTSHWERGPVTSLPARRFRIGRLYVSQSTVGSQGAEAVVFWTSFPDDRRTDPCWNLHRPIGPSAADLVSAMATRPGIRLVRGPRDVRVGGRPARHAVLEVFLDLGCNPGFFFTWQPRSPHGECWAACWLESSVGDTIRVWVVDVGGTRLVVEAQTSEGAGSTVVKEIRQLVQSIRFRP